MQYKPQISFTETQGPYILSLENDVLKELNDKEIMVQNLS